MAGPGGADGGSASSGPDAVGRARNGAPGREGLLRGVPGQRPGGSAGRASDPDGLTITDLTVSFDALALGAKVVVGTGTMGGAPVVGAAATGGSSRFAEALYGLADLAHECGGVSAALRSETAVRVLEAACRTPGASRAVQAARVPDYLAFADLLERALRPLSLDWYDAAGLGDVDLCHAAGGGSAALPGLLAKRFFGVPLLVTEYGVQLRAQYLAAGGARVPVRALMAAFHRRLAAEVYERAALITPGNTHTRRWQEKCGADRAKLRTVYPGMAADRFQTVGEDTSAGDPTTLVWVGRIDPTKDLIALLHAFAEVRRAEPDARLRIFYAGQASGAAPGTQSHGPGPGLYGDAPDGGRGGGAVGGYGAGRARRAGRDFVGDGGGSGHGGGARGCGSAGGGSAGFGGTVFGGAFGGGAYGFGAAGRGSAGYDGAGHGVGAGRSGGSGGSDYGSGSGLGAGSGYGEGSSYGVGPSYGAGSAYGVDGPAYGVGQGYETGPAYGAGPGHGAGPGYAGGSGHGGGAHGFGAPASPCRPSPPPTSPTAAASRPSSSPTRPWTRTRSGTTRSPSRRSAAPARRSWPTRTPAAASSCSPASSRASRSASSRRCSAAGPRSPRTRARWSRSSAARGSWCRRATRAPWPTRAWRCCATPNAANGSAPPPVPARSNSSRSSRTSRHFAAFTWS